MTHNRNLDSLRAAAALLVVAYHWQTVLPFGWMGVQFFFVLSGFFITGIILKDKEAGIAFGVFVRSFFTRRALRLFPLYFGYLGLLSIAYLIVRQPIEFGDSAASLFTYTVNFRETLPTFQGHRAYNHLWSLAVE